MAIPPYVQAFAGRFPPTPLGEIDLSGMTFGKLLVRLLGREGTSMNVFSTQIGISTAQVSRIISGKRAPLFKDEKILAEALDLYEIDDMRWLHDVLIVARQTYSTDFVQSRDAWENYWIQRVRIYRADLHIESLEKSLKECGEEQRRLSKLNIKLEKNDQ